MKRFARGWRWAICLVLLVFAVACSAPAGSQQSFTREDLTGVWQADYSRYDLLDSSELQHLLDDPPAIKTVRGIETITLAPDGTFEQRFESETGSVSLAGIWTVEGNVVHLEDGKLFVYGLTTAENLAQGKAVYHTVDCEGRDVQIVLSELALCIQRDRKVPGGVVLQHLPVGDPDAPEYVTFYRTETR